MENTLIDRDIIRNHIDTIILHLLYEKDRYGYELFKEVPARTNGAYELKEPSLYSAFRRLEQAKLIESYWGEESQGGRRKYYTITSAGTAYYQNTRSEWEKVKQIMEMILHGSDQTTSGEQKQEDIT